jgi:hypothetical protein
VSNYSEYLDALVTFIEAAQQGLREGFTNDEVAAALVAELTPDKDITRGKLVGLVSVMAVHVAAGLEDR